MDENLRSIIRAMKSLQKKGLLYIEDNVELKSEVNYQFILNIVENLDLTIDIEEYEKIKDNREELIYQLALLSFSEKQLVSDFEIEFIEGIIMNYMDIEDPVILFDDYVFVQKKNVIQELYEKSVIQIKEKKFPKMIFKSSVEDLE
ncbi:hypothetical protein [Clostridium algidicarnis]|uniref:Uncharacterized protein n=1 Tax=Clostridium algidicarnis DSM 15099 TaxID=1121295 RepID=A0A2S6FVJ6_9CLOT|nr:hypothetical protein [Clostridium algidicarnis]MBU3206119.1 hypothetical protein [Clostridium algidicarnis]MCB2286068.1 hypothetical protein [Clostridium algidicarnis]PPK45949.1 hypothetical protein BD821_11830 [Clostridium algidicarnis DSM 15099]